MAAVTRDPAEGLMEQSPTPRNVEARGGGFSFPVLSGILDTIVGGRKGKRQREEVVGGLLTINLKRGRAAPGE